MASAEPELWKRAAAYGMHGERVDGNDVLAVREAADAAASRWPATSASRRCSRRSTYRFRGHSVVDPAGLPHAEEIASWKARDPITLLRGPRDRGRPADDETVKRMRREVDERGRARRSRRPRRPRRRPGLGLFDHVYSDADTARAVRAHGHRGGPFGEREGTRAMADMTYRQALRRALDEELARDESVFLMGEEIGLFEGSYKITAGLWKKFGAQARPRHADRRRGLRRRRRRRGDARAAAGRRDHDDQLHPGGDRPDREPRRQDPLHVRRQGRRCRW